VSSPDGRIGFAEHEAMQSLRTPSSDARIGFAGRAE
jgi:hypothetical protein